MTKLQGKLVQSKREVGKVTPDGEKSKDRA